MESQDYSRFAGEMEQSRRQIEMAAIGTILIQPEVFKEPAHAVWHIFLSISSTTGFRIAETIETLYFAGDTVDAFTVQGALINRDNWPMSPRETALFLRRCVEEGASELEIHVPEPPSLGPRVVP